MKWLLYILFSLWLVLILMTELVPSSEWNAVWIISVVAFSTIGFYAVSERNANPMKLRTGRAGQTPFVSNTCRDTERAVTAVFARAKTTTLNGGDAAATGAGMRFSLGA